MTALARPTHAGRDPRTGAVVVAGCAFAALLTLGLERYLGIVALVVPLAVVLGVLALGRPVWLALVLFALDAALELTGGVLPGGRLLYTPLVPKGPSPLELVLIALLIAVVLGKRARQEPLRLPTPFGAPLTLLVLASAMGVAVGHSNGVGISSLFNAIHTLGFLFLLPVLLVNVLDTPGRLRGAVLVAVALALAKAVLGLVSLPLGTAAADGPGGSPITYYEPTANLLMMIAVLFALTAVLRRVAIPVWARWGAWLSLAALVLSYRRSFWIAGVLAIALVVAFAAGPVGRRLLVPVAAVLAAGLWLALSGTVVTESQNPVVARAQSLSPTQVENNAEDRYRLDERRNVLANLRQHPITGLGFNVNWTQYYPLSVQHDDGQQYVHMAVLWWWLKLGILGPITYAWLMAAAIVTGVRVWRRHQDALVRVGALAVATALAGMIVAELTASFTGVDERYTVLVAALLGFLAAARAQLQPGRPA